MVKGERLRATWNESEQDETVDPNTQPGCFAYEVLFFLVLKDL